MKLSLINCNKYNILYRNITVICGKQRETIATIQSVVKLQVLVPQFEVEDLFSAELQPRFLTLQ